MSCGNGFGATRDDWVLPRRARTSGSRRGAQLLGLALPPGGAAIDAAAERQVGRIGFHRDTWSSNVPQQTNWWTTIYPLASERTLAFYPEYWSRPLANTSADWDLDEIRARRRAGSATRI